MRIFILHKSEPRRITTRTGTMPKPWKTWQVGRLCFQTGG